MKAVRVTSVAPLTSIEELKRRRRSNQRLIVSAVAVLVLALAALILIDFGPRLWQ